MRKLIQPNFLYFMAAGVASAGLIFISACGKAKTSSSSPTGSIGSIADLSAVTSGVSGTGSNISLHEFSEMDGGAPGTPGTGQPKPPSDAPKGGSSSGAGLANTNWNGKSFEMCQTENMVAQSYGEAGQADKIMCYISAMVKDGIVPATDNVYDGTTHYYSFTPPAGGDHGGQGGGGGGGSSGMVIEVTSTKDANGNISSFALGTCEAGSTLNEYVSYSISNGVTTAVSYSTHSQGAMSGTQMTTAVGQQDGKGGWLSKDLVTDAQFSMSGGGASAPSFSQQMHMDFEQYATYGTMLGYFLGTFTAPGGSSQTNSGAMASAFQLIGSSSLSTFSVGDGSFTGQFGGGNSLTVSWSGDTGKNLSDATTGAYYTVEQKMTVPTPTAVTITAPTGASWNCKPASGSATALSFAGSKTFQTDMQACNTQFGFTNGGWQACGGTNVH